MFPRLKIWTCSLAGLLGIVPLASAADKEWTTITGQVVLDPADKIPVMAVINPTKDAKDCNKNGAFTEEKWLVDAKNRGVKNVVVYLIPEGAKRGTAFPVTDINPKLAKSSKPTVEIDQPCCSFIPHIVALRDDQSLTIKNSAAIAHNAKLVGPNVDVNPLIPPAGSHVQANIKADIFPNDLNCSIHGWMNAKVFVFDSPYFAVTDADGKFEIKDAPVGKFNLVFWHEANGWVGGKAGRAGKSFPLKAGTTAIPTQVMTLSGQPPALPVKALKEAGK